MVRSRVGRVADLNSIQLFVKYLLGFVLLILNLSCATHSASDKQQGRYSARNLNSDSNSKLIRKNIIRSDYREGEVADLCTHGLKNMQVRLNTQVHNAFGFDRVLAEFSDELMGPVFMSNVHINEKVRSEASACEEKYDKLIVDIFTRRDLYKKIISTQGKTPDEKRIVSEFKLKFDKNGMALSDAGLAQLKRLKLELTALKTQFSKNLNENKSFVSFSESDLKGVSQEFLSRLKKNKSGQYVVTTKSTDFLQVMENASNPSTRKKMLSAYDNREARGNTELLEKAILVRQKIAKLMGYKVWADYQIDGRMAKNSESALHLISDLKEKLRPRLKADLDILIKAKQEMEDPNAKDLTAWDLRYFAYQVKKTSYSLNDDVIREYFPKDNVMSGMFDIYSKLFNVYYKEVKDAEVWTPDVKLYAILDGSDNSVIGYFYTDFIPREGKYGHAAAFTLVEGRVLPDGRYSEPVSAIVANFSPPANGKPSLFTHDEVETLFHEFGHIMHQTLTRAPYSFLSGTSTAQDFVEAPSQMLENWVWDADMLNKLSGHYLDIRKKLPKELIEKMLEARDFNQGYHYSRQIMLGLTDLSMHMLSGPVDVTELYKKFHLDVLTVPAIGNSHFPASFGHLMSSYDAGYYGYIWSEVFAADMFTAFMDKGLLNSNLGRRYRDIILGEGNMRDPYDLISAFLGRAPNNEAFLKKLGL